MGTNAVTQIRVKGTAILQFQRTYDGGQYHANELWSILNKGNCKVVNGYSNENTPEYFNTIGNLAFYLVAKLQEQMKNNLGNFYIEPPRPSDIGQYDYSYIIELEDTNQFTGILQITVFRKDEQIYSGLLKDFDPDKTFYKKGFTEQGISQDIAYNTN